MLCGGYVGRVYGKKLEDLKGMLIFILVFIVLYKLEFFFMELLKCCCVGKKYIFVVIRNKFVCGCIGFGFI